MLFSERYTPLTPAAIKAAGIPVDAVPKIMTGDTTIIERIGAGGIALVIDTPTGRDARADDAAIRRAAIRSGTPCITTLAAAVAAGRAMVAGGGAWVRALQDLETAPTGPRILGAQGREL